MKQFYGSSCVSIVRESLKMAFVQVFVKSQYIVLGIHYPGWNDVSHVKVTICTGWSPKVLTC